MVPTAVFLQLMSKFFQPNFKENYEGGMWSQIKSTKHYD